MDECEVLDVREAIVRRWLLMKPGYALFVGFWRDLPCLLANYPE